MRSKLPFLLQGLFVVFLWSASKIVLKMGLEQIPPYFFAAVLQLTVLGILLIYAWFARRKYSFRLTGQDKFLMTLSGIVGYGAATLFVLVGLQYVTGATAGLIAATSVIFNLLISGILVGEKLRREQYLGILLLLVGVAVFLGNKILGGTLVGISLLLLAEMAYAFNNSVSRMIAKTHTDNVALPLVLIGNGAGALVLIPFALLSGGLPHITWNPQLLAGVLTVAVIFAFGGLMWNSILDKLRVIEVSLVANTMIVQVAILSVLFLHEALSAHNIYGGLLVLLGALIVDGRLIFPKMFRLKLA